MRSTTRPPTDQLLRRYAQTRRADDMEQLVRRSVRHLSALAA